MFKHLFTKLVLYLHLEIKHQQKKTKTHEKIKSNGRLVIGGWNRNRANHLED